MQAIKYNSLNWTQWLALDEPTRGHLVAFYRLEHLIQLHYQLERIAEANAAARSRI